METIHDKTKAYLIELARIRHEAADRVEAEISRTTGGFEGAFNFDVEAFVEDLVIATQPQDIMVIPKDMRESAFGAVIAEVTTDGLSVAHPNKMQAAFPLMRKPYDIEAMYYQMADAWEGSKIVAFPKTEFEYTSENRPRTAVHTDAVLSKVVASYVPFEPDKATQQTMKGKSIPVYGAEEGMEPLPKNNTRPVFLGYTDYSRLLKYPGRCSGFVFNPYRKTSQSMLLSLRKQSDSIRVKYVHRYRTYEADYPTERPTTLFTYCLDAWPRIFGLKCSQVHPKWYPYDFVTTEKHVIPNTLITLMTTEFIEPKFSYYDNKTKLQVRVPEKQARERESFFVEPNDLTMMLLVRRITGTLVKLKVQRLSKKLVNVLIDGVWKPISLLGVVPQDPRIYTRFGEYYRLEPGPSVLWTVNMPIYYQYSNTRGSIVDDIYTFDIVYASRYITRSEVLPTIRDYIHEITEIIDGGPLETYGDENASTLVPDQHDWSILDDEKHALGDKFG